MTDCVASVFGDFGGLISVLFECIRNSFTSSVCSHPADIVLGHGEEVYSIAGVHHHVHILTVSLESAHHCLAGIRTAQSLVIAFVFCHLADHQAANAALQKGYS